MKKKISLILTLIILISTNATVAYAAYNINEIGVPIEAESVLLMNTDNGQTLLKKNSDKRMNPASLTKIMTAIVVLEHYKDKNIDEETITAKAGLFNEFKGINISNADIRSGEVLTVRQLLYCIMLQSANEAANILADQVGGNTEGFAQIMNDTAKRIGANNTNFVNAHGLYNENHYTTAEDMAIISKHAMTLPGFMDIVSTSTYKIPQTNKHEPRTLTTTVLLQDKTRGAQYYKPYVKGIKTGTLPEAGRCVVTTATKNGVNYLLVVLNAPLSTTASPQNKSFTDTINIYEWAFKNLNSLKVADKNEAITEMPLKLASGKDFLLVYPKDDFLVSVPDGANESAIKKVFEMPEIIKAPIEQGQIIGKCEFVLFDEVVGSVELIANEKIEVSYPLLIMDTIKRGFSSVWAKIVLGIVVVFAGVYLFSMVKANQNKERKIKRSKKIRRRKI